MVGNLVVWLATVLSLLVVDIIVPGVELRTFTAALLAGVSLGVVNALVKPVISTLSLPLTFLSFGAFSLVVNGLCFWLASFLVPGFAVSNILGFILGPIVLSFVSTFLGKYFAEKFPNLQLGGKSEITTTDS
ncbi:MAG: phage holin family protein [Cyanobacteria bacterium P01_A01_bin.135]